MPYRSVPVDVEQVQREMARRGWRSKDIAALIGMTEGGFSRVLRGSCSPETLQKINAAFQANDPIEGMDALLLKKGERCGLNT